MSERERKMVETWKAELRTERQMQPKVDPSTVRRIGDSFRRLRRLVRQGG